MEKDPQDRQSLPQPQQRQSESASQKVPLQPSEKKEENLEGQSHDLDSDENSDLDEDVQDLQEQQSSQHSILSESEFEISQDDDLIADQQKEINVQRQQQKLNGQIFQINEQDENLEDYEDRQEKVGVDVLKNVPKITLKDFQKTLFQKSQDKNTIIYLPTGLGKTRIAIAGMYYYLSITQKKKIVFLANTIQLVKQQAEAIKKTLYGIIQDQTLSKELIRKLQNNYAHLDWDWDRISKEVVCIHGQKSDQIGQTKRKKIQSNMMSKKQFLKKIQNSTVIVMIAQMFLNCLRRGFIKLTDFSFMVFDQCHHCKGDHPYAGIMNQFYFEKKRQMQKISQNKVQESLPKIMGLTASPVSQPLDDHRRLQKQIRNLCINLDSNFAEYYQNQKLQSSTKIQVIKIEEQGDKDNIPLLIKHFQRYGDHKQSYLKLQYHFPLYFQCVKDIVETLQHKHENLSVQSTISQLHSIDLFLFYDIKECLLIKIRDLWLQLGEFVMVLAFSQMVRELKNMSGLRHEQNLQLLNVVIEKLQDYQKKFMLLYNKCERKFFSSKLNKLIQILHPNNDIIQQDRQLNSNSNTTDLKKEDKDKIHQNHQGLLRTIKKEDMVLVFAFKRRTVKYLDIFFKKYRDTIPQDLQKYYLCTGVTGYSSKQFNNEFSQGHSYLTDPSAKVDQNLVVEKYQDFLQEVQAQSYKNVGQSKKLVSEMNRYINAKTGKSLLQVQEKYASQIRKIMEFRKREIRILITTSVTQEGFDIPGCNKVISFDTPFSMKSYIQIKGRARKKGSIYYIFTTGQNYDQMVSNKLKYDDTINATYELAIKHIAKEIINPSIPASKPQYKKVKTKGGALLNTNYSLEILKAYFATLAQPNKAYYHYAETPNICYKCIIKFPDTDPSGIPFMIGEPHTKKDQALKSAAFLAVKQLKKMGLIKDDLRPSKTQLLQEEYQLQRYDDLATIQNDQQYRKIFIQYVQLKCQDYDDGQNNNLKINRLRLYFQSILPSELDFPQINQKFKQNQKDFSQELISFKFQIYKIQFSNDGNNNFFKEYYNSNDIGILTCFDQEDTEQIFSEYRYVFQENPKESFYMKRVQTNLQMTRSKYDELRRVHQFLVAGSLNKEVQYYKNVSQSKPTLTNWVQLQKHYNYDFDPDRHYYPIMVLLKRKNNSQKKSEYQIDKNANSRIQRHKQIFKNLYIYHNKSKSYKNQTKFEENLTEQFNAFSNDLTGKQNLILAQGITTDFCFHKCLITNKTELTKQIQEESKKKKKNNLENRENKLKKCFQHGKTQNRQVFQRIMWRDYQKEKKSQFFNRGGIKQKQTGSSGYYILKQYLQYPISPQTLFKISLTLKYVYEAIDNYSLSLHFRNFHLRNIFKAKQKTENVIPTMRFKYYENIILANATAFFQYIAQNGRSKILRHIGRSYKQVENPNSLSINLNMTMNNNNTILNNLTNMSVIGKQGFPDMNISLISQIPQNTSQSVEMSMLNLNQSTFKDFKADKDQQNNEDQQKLTNFCYRDSQLKKIKIPQILRVLTSKIYKHNKSQNYEEYEFIGDVVLKFLATLQIFMTRPNAEQGEMHISRANIICNANLHKRAIKNKMFRYILTNKRSEVPPPYKHLFDSSKVKRDKYKRKSGQEDIWMYNTASQAQGYQYIPGKVHADVMEALIGIFYLKNMNLEDCQAFLYAVGVLQFPTTHIDIQFNSAFDYQNIPEVYTQFQGRIGYNFKHKGLLIQALTHPSFKSNIQSIVDQHNMTKMLDKINSSTVNNMSFISQKSKPEDYRSKVVKAETFYQRLQFLGDSILDLIVVEQLYETYQDGLDQGTLSLLKQAGVSNKSLGLIALKFGMHQLNLMDISQMDLLNKQFTRIQQRFDHYLAHPDELANLKINAIKLLGDVFEGLIGAIFIDQDFNYPKTKKIIMDMIGKYIKTFTDKDYVKDFPLFKYQTFLMNNNYKKCRIEKDASVDMKDGLFRYVLLDRKNSVVEQCYQATQKDAWDEIQQKILKKMKKAE